MSTNDLRTPDEPMPEETPVVGVDSRCDVLASLREPHRPQCAPPVIRAFLLLLALVARPAAAIVCEADPPDCGTCATAHCNTTTGRWSCSNKANGTACDDANACTYGDHCTSGVCGGTSITCSS